MKRALNVLLTLCLLLAIGRMGSAVLLATPVPLKGDRHHSSSSADPNFLAGQALARFRSETTLAEFKQTMEAAHATGYRELTPWGVYLITFPEAIPVVDVIDHLQAIPSILYAEPNYKLEAFTHLRDGLEAGRAAVQATEGGPVAMAVIDAGGEGTHLATRAIAEIGEGDVSILPLRAGPGPWLLTSATIEAIHYAIQQRAQVIALSFQNWWTSKAMEDALRVASQDRILLVSLAGETSKQWDDVLRTFPQVIPLGTTEGNGGRTWFLSDDPLKISRVRVPSLLDSVNLTRQGDHFTSYRHVEVVPGKVGGAAQFRREERQYLSIPDSPVFQMKDTSFTIALWVYFDSLPAGVNQGIVAKAGDEKTIEYALYTENRPPNIRFLLTNSGQTTRRADDDISTGDYEHIDSKPVLPKLWYFMVATYDRETGELSLYRNNLHEGTLRLPGALHSATAPFTVGRLPFGGNGDPQRRYLNGLVDELGLWKRALSKRELADLYNGGMGNSFDGNQKAFRLDTQKTLVDGLVAYYPFDENGYRWRIGRHSE